MEGSGEGCGLKNLQAWGWGVESVNVGHCADAGCGECERDRGDLELGLGLKLGWTGSWYCFEVC